MKNEQQLEALKTLYAGKSGKKITEDNLNEIGNFLITEFVEKKKTYTLKELADFIREKNWVSHENNKNPEHAYKNTAYKCLIRLGVLVPVKREKKVTKSAEQPGTITEAEQPGTITEAEQPGTITEKTEKATEKVKLNSVKI